MLAFNCPACKHYGEADNALEGEIIGCGNCRTQFRLPRPQAPVPTTALEHRPSVKEPGKGAVVESWVRCRLCGARRTTHDRCAFCGYEFRTDEQVQLDETRRFRRQVGVQSATVLALAFTLLGIPAGAIYWKTSYDDNLRLCQGNLMIFHGAVRNFEERAGELPKSTGREFLIAIAQNEHVSHALLCPSVDRDGTLRAVDFRGPGRPWADLGPEDPVAADLEGNHHGITVLRKNGQIEYAAKGTPLYQLALTETQE